MERLEIPIERLRRRVRLTWAFHAREVRFEREADDGFAAIFPETYSFHLERHDPVELAVQLEDLWSDPRRLGPGATRRDAQECVRRLLAGAPRYVERLLDGLDADPRLSAAARARLHGDARVLVSILERFLHEKELATHPDARYAGFHLRKLAWRTASTLVRERVPEAALAAWLAGAPCPGDGEPSERAVLRALAGEGDEAALWLRLAERDFGRWLDGACLDTGNDAFEREDSPFATREREILDAVSVDPARELRRTPQLSPFLRRAGNRDCLRLLRRLEVWFLRQYDVPRAAALIRHAENLVRGRADASGVLSWHSTRNYGIAIAVLIWPFVGAALAYDRAGWVFDVAASVQALAVLGAALWYLVYRFVWQKDLAFFHGAVPRIGAGIIVGYLPVFLIDEVWDLSRRPWFPLGVTVVLLGFTTLLYLYVEVRRSIPDPREAFARTERIFLLGVVEALALGLVVTTLLGPFMVARTWGEEGQVSLEWLRASTPPFVGELPRIMGIEPIHAFPTAVLLMTFMALFIGTFLQLLWEELPITEPL